MPKLQSLRHLIDIAATLDALPQDVSIRYDLLVNGAGIAEWAPHLLYPGAQGPNFVLHSRTQNRNRTIK